MPKSSPTKILRQRLPNGLELVFEPMPWLATVSFTLLVPFGAATDPAGEEGSATVLYDWLQRGAGGRSSRELNDALEDLGVRRGGGPGREKCSFSASLLADAWEDALALHADQLIRPNLDDAEFASARTVALEEIASLEDDPTSRMFEALLETTFATRRGNSPYGREEAIESMTPRALRAQVADRVGPQGSILAVAGGIEWERVRSAAEHALGGWEGGVTPLPEPTLAEAGRHHLDASTAQTQIGLAYPTLPVIHVDWYAHSLAMQALSGSMGSRLFAEVREKRGLVYSVNAHVRPVKGAAIAIGYAGTTPERAEETLDVTLAEIRRLYDGIDAEELERARTGLMTDLVMGGESSRGRASSLARDLWLRGQPRELEEIHGAIAALTLDEVNAALDRHPRPEPTIVTLGPAEDAA